MEKFSYDFQKPLEALSAYKAFFILRHLAQDLRSSAESKKNNVLGNNVRELHMWRADTYRYFTRQEELKRTADVVSGWLQNNLCVSNFLLLSNYYQHTINYVFCQAVEVRKN